jgi:hypothetical protein
MPADRGPETRGIEMSRSGKSLRSVRLVAAAAACAAAATLPAAAEAFNPQPDPPGRVVQVVSVAGLNPQPLPPIVFLPPR